MRRGRSVGTLLGGTGEALAGGRLTRVVGGGTDGGWLAVGEAGRPEAPGAPDAPGEAEGAAAATSGTW